MANQNLNNLDFSAEERKDLQRIQHFESLSYNPAWKMLVKEMERLVDEALTDMKKVKPDSPADAIRALHMRWQQRGYMKDAILSFVGTMIELKQDILQRGTDEHIPANPFDTND